VWGVVWGQVWVSKSHQFTLILPRPSRPSCRLENRFINPGVQPLRGPKDTPLPPTVAVANAQYLADAQAMVLRDRNHPSVMIYSLCNEGACRSARAGGGWGWGVWEVGGGGGDGPPPTASPRGARV
jgi:hypothetical protein